MGYEVDFLPVGEGSRSGDAILLRWGNLYGPRDEQTIVLVDGGYNDVAATIIEHLDVYYETDEIDIVVSTHPDADHVNGLREVVQKVAVGRLWMHLPSRHSVELAQLKEAGWTSALSLRENLRESLSAVSELEEIAQSRGITIIEPFQGVRYEANAGELYVAGPSLAYYEELLPQFRTYTGVSAVARAFEKLFEAARRFIPENWWDETLTDDGETSPENSSSAILQLIHDGRRLILTADSGIPSLERAANHLESSGRDGESLDFIQVPHHGSKRNVGPSILNRLVGPIVAEGEVSRTAFVSCAPEGEPKHPHRKVTNAFRRRGCHLVATAGKSVVHSYDAPDRPGWGPVPSLPLYTEVDDD